MFRPVYKSTGSGATALNNSGSGGISLGTSYGTTPLQVVQPAAGRVSIQTTAVPQQAANIYRAPSPASSNGSTGGSAGGGGGGSSSGGGGSVAAAPAIDYAALAAWDQNIGTINASLGNLNNQLNSGNTTIDADTANALSTLLRGYNQANTTYGENVTENKKSYIGAKNTIGANAGQALNGILRLLGSRGVSGTDTSQVAPGAVGRVATQQRSEAGQGFANNARALDTNWNTYKTGYENQVLGVQDQQTRNKKDLKDKIESTRSSLLQTLASATTQRSLAAGGNPQASVAAAQPYLNQANQINAGLSNYATPKINYNVGAYTAPALGSYTTNAVTPTFNGAAPTNDYTSPFLASLLNTQDQKKEKKQV